MEFGYFIIYEYTLIAVRQVDSCGNVNTLYSTYAVHIRQGLSQCRGGGGDANIYRRCRDRAFSLLAWSHGFFSAYARKMRVCRRRLDGIYMIAMRGQREQPNTNTYMLSYMANVCCYDLPYVAFDAVYGNASAYICMFYCLFV